MIKGFHADGCGGFGLRPAASDVETGPETVPNLVFLWFLYECKMLIIRIKTILLMSAKWLRKSNGLKMDYFKNR